MNIGFVNQKGGVGKTTLAILFADFLHKLELNPVCLDFDVQGSLHEKWKVAAGLVDKEPEIYVIKCELNDNKQILQEARDSEQIVLFDLPGSLDNPNIQEVLDEIDLMICPFLYEPISFQSTFIFAGIMKEIKIKSDIVFVPNMVKSNVRYDIKDKVKKELEQFGEISPEIKDLVNMQRIDFFNITENTVSTVEKTFIFIKEKYLNK